MNNDTQIAAIILMIIYTTLLIVFKEKFPITRKFGTNPVFPEMYAAITIVSVAITILISSKYAYLFMLAISLLCESYIYSQLPYSKYFWRDLEHASNPKYRSTRLLFVFITTPCMGIPLFYVLFIFVIEDILHFFTASSSEKKKIIGKQLPLFAKYGVKGLFLYAVIAAILLAAAKYGAEFLFDKLL